MKIGVDASCWTNNRGYGRYTRELLRALLAIDHENDYLFFLSTETAREGADLPRTERSRRIIVRTSQAPTQAASASSRRSLRDLWAMGQAVRRHAPDLDVFWFPSVYTFFPLWSRARVIITIHDTTAERYPKLIFPNWRARLFWTFKVRLAIWQSDLIATVSEAAKRNVMREFKLTEDAVRVIPDAVGAAFHPIDRTQARHVLTKYGVDGGERIILYVGGISPHKNLSTLVHAYGSLLNGGHASDTKLVLVGDYQQDVFYSSYPALRERVEELGLSGRVIFTGFVSDSELLQLYNAAELLVLPSFDEGFGLPAVEAMACGVPVVASRAGALPELIGEGGRLFNPYAPEELKDRLEEVLDNKRLREELARKALCRAQGFSWEHSARVAMSVFRELVNGHAKGTPLANINPLS